MAPRFQLVTPAEARATMAAHLLPGRTEARLGEITLATHQLAAARRLSALLTAHGGALLADDVGLGKTYVALAVARHYAHVLVVAPAALREMWRDAASRAGVGVDLVTYESLSRNPPPIVYAVAGTRAGSGRDSGIVILDEAHHARTATSRRYPRIATLIGSARTLLLTATPLHNRLKDLRSLIALFAGSRAWSMSEAELSALVYRRTAATVPGVALPGVARPRWIEVTDDSACLAALQRLPPPVPPSDGGHAGALVLLGLVRQWASSRAALVGALRRSLARSIALSKSVAAGRMPTASELQAWDVEGDAMQLAFSELVAAPMAPTLDRAALARSLHEHGTAVRRLLALLERLPDPDVERARRIAELRRMHPGEKIVCFTGFAETAAVYWRHLRAHPSVAVLSARGGEIASGRVSRDAVLRQFAPNGQRACKPGRLDDVTVLITTDLLSEGVDLRDATVVVHLDLPWSPARMEQRVGRARRMGSSASSITVYAMQPPAPSEVVLAIERRLRDKIAAAARAVGNGAAVLPSADQGSEANTAPGALDERGVEPHEGPAGDPHGFSAAERRSALLDRISTWLHDGPITRTDRDAPVAALVRAPMRGWLATVTIGRERVLIASLGGRVGSDPALLARACDMAECDACTTLPHGMDARSPELLKHAIAQAASHAAQRAAADAIAPGSGSVDEVVTGERKRGIRGRALARIHRALGAAPPHRVPRVAALAAAARNVVSGRLSAGLERQLEEITAARGDDDAAWMEAVGMLADTPAREPTAGQVCAIVVFVPTATSRA